ncbi:MAG: alpha/beta hydrolase, partial [Mycobacteriaceae bacterium]
DTSPAGIAQTEKEEKAFAGKCAARVGDDVLEHVGTREVVQDMDVIRSVLGDAKLTYVGFSYGTRIGTSYAEKFPANVRAMVLDGALDPEASPVQELIGQATGFEGAFTAFAKDCATRAGCPLGDDPAQFDARFRALTVPLIASPVPTEGPRGLGYNDAVTGTLQALYSPQLWPALTTGLAQLTQGRGDTLLKLADVYSGRGPDGHYSHEDDAFTAIRCVDDPPVTDRAVTDAADAAYRTAAPFLDDGMGSGRAPLNTCAFWPVPHTGTPHAPKVVGLAPTVVISTTGDPATPYQAGVQLARQLGGALITYRGTQHTVAFDGVSCVDDAVSTYLTELRTPPPGLTC